MFLSPHLIFVDDMNWFYWKYAKYSMCSFGSQPELYYKTMNWHKKYWKFRIHCMVFEKQWNLKLSSSSICSIVIISVVRNLIWQEIKKSNKCTFIVLFFCLHIKIVPSRMIYSQMTLILRIENKKLRNEIVSIQGWVWMEWVRLSYASFTLTIIHSDTVYLCIKKQKWLKVAKRRTIKMKEYEYLLREISVSYAFVPVWIDLACILSEISYGHHIFVTNCKWIGEYIKILYHMSFVHWSWIWWNA